MVDCGTLQQAADRLALRAASHIAWVLPATRGGVRRAERVLAAVPDTAGAAELIVARREPERAAPRALKALKALAESRHAPLVLLPRVSDPSRTRPARCARAQVEPAGDLRRCCSDDRASPSSSAAARWPSRAA